MIARDAAEGGQAGWLRGVVAHRGAPRAHGDNTVAGILTAIRLGAQAVEVDVRMTADGVPVLHHDPHLPGPWWARWAPNPLPGWLPGRLRRAAGRRLPITALTADQLRDRAPHVPTFAEALAASGASGVPLVLDVGTIETVQACLEAMRADPPAARAWFCGAPGALAWLREQDATAPLLLSWSGRRPPSESLVAQVAPTMFNPGHRTITPAVVEHWHRRGVGVCTWTVDRSRRRSRLLGWGVDAIISNDVAGAVRDVSRGLPPPAADGTMSARKSHPSAAPAAPND